MTIRGLGAGWQTAMADLTLILFLVVAAAYREDVPEEPGEDAEQAADIALGQPMAVFRPGGDADLTRWLAAQHMAAGEVATVIVRHRPGAATQAVKDAARLVAEVERAGEKARLMVEPSAVPETLVVIAHDERGRDGMEIAYTR